MVIKIELFAVRIETQKDKYNHSRFIGFEKITQILIGCQDTRRACLNNQKEEYTKIKDCFNTGFTYVPGNDLRRTHCYITSMKVSCYPMYLYLLLGKVHE